MTNQKNLRQRLAGSSAAILALSALAGLAFWAAGGQRLPAEPPPILTEEQLAMEAFLNPIPLELLRRADPEFAGQEAEAVLAIAHPEIALEEQLKDLAWVKAQQEASVFILNPLVVEAELKKDPNFGRQQEEALRLLQEGGGR